MRSKNEEILKRIVEIINDSYYQGEASPSMKDIADSLDISLPTASRYINELISRGELEKDSRYGELRTPKIIRDCLRNAASCGRKHRVLCKSFQGTVR